MRAREINMPNDEWHLNKRFAITTVVAIIGLVIAVLANCAAGIWYASRLEITIEQDHSAITSLSIWKEKQDDDKAKIDAHLAVVDEKLSEQSVILRRIDDRMEKQFYHGK